jgi:uncharacterized protein YfaS (alpha-2-macroglobulin family)
MLAASEWGIDDKKVGDWSGKLMRSIKPEGRWGSTADTGWALLALAKHFKKKDSAKPGSYLVRAHFGGETSEFRVMDTAHTIELPISALVRNPVVKIESDAKDVLHYALEMTYPETPAKKPVPSALNVAKYVTNLNGSSEIRVGDVLKVRLVLELGDQGGADRSGFFEYLVLDDPVPAGVVAINAELKSEGRDADGDSDKDQDDADDPYSFMPSYQEFRDEGVRVFKNRIYPGVYEYSYFARAVMEGEFFMRSTRLSLMYKPETQASVPGTTVKILPAQ